MAIIDDVLAQAQRDLSAREVAIVRQLLESYGIALRRIERELRTLDAQIAEAIASGQTVNEQWITRQRWWRELEGSIHTEMAKWSDQATRSMAALQTTAVHTGVDVAGSIAKLAGSPLQGRVYSQAFERWVSAIQPTSPLRLISLPRYEARIRQSIIQRMTQGIGNGRAPRSIVREILRDVGITDPDSPVQARLMTLVRTESLRAYRGASMDTMEQLRERGIVSGYVWLAKLDVRTCPACVARHGQYFEVPPGDHHPNCRCVLSPLVDPAIVPGGGWHGQTGPEWFAEQSEEVQRRMLISDARYDAYAAGTPLSEMVSVRHSDVWGNTVGIKPVHLLPKAPAEPKPASKRATPSTAAIVLRGRSVPGYGIARAGD